MHCMAADHKATVAQLALAWLLSKNYVSVILVGASNVSQFDDNLGALNVNLSRGELDELNQMTRPASVYPNWFQEKTQDTAVSKALAK